MLHILLPARHHHTACRALIISLHVLVNSAPLFLSPTFYDFIMTTNHRPTLESKRGRSNAIKDTILHARSLPGQLSMKLRLDIIGGQVESTLGKRALEELEEDEKRLKKNQSDQSILIADTLLKELHHETNTYKDDGEEERSIKGTESDESSGEESEDDEESLMKELAKIRSEKEAKRKKQETLVGNPLIAEDGSAKLQKKNWRSGTRFQQKNEANSGQKYTSDTLHSSTHQNFLSKYIR